MKILHIVPSYWPAFGRGGPTWSVHNLNKLLVQKGFEVTVFTTNIGLGNKIRINQEYILDGVKVWYFPITFAPWQYSWAMHDALKRRVIEFDAIHITSVFLAVSTLGAYYAKKFNKPYIISPRGNLMKEPLKHNHFKKLSYLFLIERKNLRDAAAIHFTAEIEREEYISAKSPLKKSFVIPNNHNYEPETSYYKDLSYDLRKKYGIPEKAKIILFLGRINWKKGFDTLIPAFIEVLKKEPESVLAIVGEDDGYNDELQFLIDKHGLREKVFFTGLLIGFEKVEAFKNSEIFVLPSYSENFGMAVLDAMAIGVPVIITEKVGLAESVNKAGAGIVIKKDKDELANSILKILQNRDLSKKMGEAGRKLAQVEFGSEKIAEKWISAYNDLVR